MTLQEMRKKTLQLYKCSILCHMDYMQWIMEWVKNRMIYNVNMDEYSTRVLGRSQVPAMEFKTSLEKDVSTEFACFIADWL